MPVIPGQNDQEMKDKLEQGAKEAEQAKSQRLGRAGEQSAHKVAPVIPENMPEAASKEELQKRAEELNKK